MKLSRAERSLLADWWFTVDRVLLGTILAIACVGLFLSLAASPAIALKRGLPTFYFVERHFFFTGLALAGMLAISMLTPANVRRLSFVVLAGAFALMALTLFTGAEVNGARRWLHVAGYSIQPSEIAKPAFVVMSAWLLAEAERRADVPAVSFSIGIYLLFAGLLILQPDVGQTFLISFVWCALLFLSGKPIRWFLVFLPVLASGFGAAYLSFGYVRSRVARFLDPAAGDTYQTDRALQSFIEGGFFGRGPGEGTIKTVLPDAHSDFIFAVIGEEYGILACLVVLGLFALTVVRVFARQLSEPDPFTRLASAGLVLLFALQAFINMAVSVGLIPAKGITLPLISSGGSSTLATGLAMGMLLALTRRRPDPARVKKPSFVARRAVSYDPTGPMPS